MMTTSREDMLAELRRLAPRKSSIIDVVQLVEETLLAFGRGTRICTVESGGDGSVKELTDIAGYGMSSQNGDSITDVTLNERVGILKALRETSVEDGSFTDEDDVLKAQAVLLTCAPRVSVGFEEALQESRKQVELMREMNRYYGRPTTTTVR